MRTFWNWKEGFPRMPLDRQMPQYQSHKKVWALRILSVEVNTIHFMSSIYAPREVDPKIFSRYIPVSGDYFVVYDDGYESISPKKAFEEGYTLVSGSERE
jgi:hypothetical protein